jgi:anti-sigma factor RsiW
MRFLPRRFAPRRQLSCEEVGQLLQTYLDDELDRDAAHKVEHHLEDCVRCGLETEAYEALRASLQRIGTEPDPATVARLRAFGQRLAGTGPDHAPPNGAT